jgi:predicted short-subunit dehydrogenase-like oxidoreductase (DUF2520 family)
MYKEKNPARKHFNRYSIMGMKTGFSIVGAGRVGRALGRSLRDRGWRVNCVMARSEKKARTAVRAINGGIACSGFDSRLLDSQLVLITTPDGALSIVAEELARAGGKRWRGRIVLHTSGALDRGVLAPLHRLGAATGSMHPMQTFSGRRVPPLSGVLFGIEGDTRALAMARRIVKDLGGTAAVIPNGRKAAYHAAAVLVAGLGMGLVESAIRVLMSVGFTRQRAMQSLWKLLRQVLSDAERLGTRKAWVGPLVRGDFGTIAAHHRALRRYPPEFRQLYEALARVAVRTLHAQPERVMRELNAALSE